MPRCDHARPCSSSWSNDPDKGRGNDEERLADTDTGGPPGVVGLANWWRRIERGGPEAARSEGPPIAGSSSPDPQDRLIARLRERAGDPERRVDTRPTEFSASLSGLDVAELFTRSRSAADDLRRLRDQGVNDELRAKADDIERRMTTPVARPLPGPATAATLEAAEARLGVALPPLLRRLYLEVANGGLGPGSGILGIRGGWTDHGRSIEDLYEEMSDSTTEDPRWVWPAGLVPLVDYGGAFGCVDASTAEGRIVDWDPDELDDRGPDGGWSRSFREVAPSLAAWLEAWLDAPAPVDETPKLLAQAMSTIPEVTRQHWASMTPEQRAEYGLPATGWGRALFGDAWGDDPRDQG